MAPIRTGRGRHHQHEGLRAAKGSALAHGRGDPRPHPASKAKSIDFTVDTLEGDTTAYLRQTTMALAEKVMVIEERTIFLGDLLRIRRGTKEVENFVRRQGNLRHELKENLNREEMEEMI